MHKLTKAACAALPVLMTVPIGSAAVAQDEERVYAICTVRNVAVFENGDVEGKVFRSTIFSAPADYEADISLNAGQGGLVSKHFEAWVATKHGLRPDRVSLGDGDEHYCIEAPFTPEGERKLVETAQQWAVGSPAGIEQVFTEWTPWLGKRVARLVPPSAEATAQYKAALEARTRTIEADQRRLQEAAAEAANAVAAHEAELQRARAAQAEYERQQQAYREEYFKATGRYPDQ